MSALQPARDAWRCLRAATNAWSLATLVIAGLVALPILTVAAHILLPAGDAWDHLAATVLPRYMSNTLALMIGVGTGVTLIGVGTAWLVVMCRFPGRGVLEWALLLPLAVPTYVIDYAYTDFFQYAGPAQSWLRATFDWGRGDYWFPPVRSLGGAMTLMATVLYPYVYLLTRAAFLEQSVGTLDVARTLGRGPWRMFAGVAVPLARPAIAGGLALALMETLNDFGAVQFFGVDTFTTGIFRTWFGLGEPVAAAQLAACLLGFVVVLVLLERFSRGSGRFSQSAGSSRALPQYQLRGPRAAAAFLACGLPVTVGFLVPAALLLRTALDHGHALLSARFTELVFNSVTLATVAAALAVALAVILSYGVRLHPSRVTGTAARVASLGYAIPGSVIAVGLLIPLGWLDQQAHGLLRQTFGITPGLIFTGTVVALIYAYVVRFLSVSYNAVEASLGRVTPSMDAASRTLGQTAGSTLRRVHAPLMRSSLLAAGILVFVDVMKELPATVILRPFSFDTLAVRAHNLASDERLGEAAAPALAIVVAGIVPVILLSNAMRRSRAGTPRAHGTRADATAPSDADDY
ncbi:MAG: iron ABC transporter permease [Ectothiorhodospiraceae bacterium]